MNAFDLCMVAPLTPLSADGSLNPGLVGRQAGLLLRRGAQGFYLCGGTGEGLLLTVRERMELVERWRAALPPGIPMIVQIGAGSPEDAVALARHAEENGASGISSVTPSPYAARDAAALAGYFAILAAAAPSLPFFYYHNSAAPGLKIQAFDFLTAAQGRIANLGGVKFTDQNLMDYNRCLRFGGGRYAILYGKDELLLGALAMGGRGFIGGSYNLLSPLLRRVTESWARGRVDDARRAQETLIDAIALFGRYGGLAALKAASRGLGLDLGPLRPPLAGLSQAEGLQLQEELETVWPEWRTASVPLSAAAEAAEAGARL